MNKPIDVVIIGGGPAGISAAIWCKRLDLNHLLIESKGELGGQLEEIHNEIIDYPGLPTGNGHELKEMLVHHLNLLSCVHQINARVSSIHPTENLVTIDSIESPTKELRYRFLILATGSSVKKLGIPGELQMISRGETYSASRDRNQFTGKQVIVVGGGDRAFEGALLLAEIGAKVTLVHRSTQFRAREEYRTPVLSHPNIKVITNATIAEIYGEKKITGVRLVLSDGTQPHLPTEAVFIRIGVSPNSHLLQGQVDCDCDGYISVNSFCQTSRDNIFAIGDVCTRPLYSSIASSIGQGMIAAKQLSLLLGK